MSGFISFPLHARSLNHLLQETQSEGNEKRHLYINTKAKMFRVFEETKQASEIKKEGFRPFDLREVVIAGRKLKTEFEADPQIAHELSPLLGKMSREHASTQVKSCCLVRLIALVLECVNNFFKKLGFRSTASVASKFARELAQIPAKKLPEVKKSRSKPFPEKQSTRVVNSAPAEPSSIASTASDMPSNELPANEIVDVIEPSPDFVEFEGLVKQRATKINIPKSKQSRLNSYSGSVRIRLKGEDEPLSQLTVSKVLHDAKYDLENQSDTSQSFFGLMRAISDEEWYDPKTQRAYVNFSSPSVIQVVCDLIIKGNPEFIESFFLKLKEHPTFNADGVKACLRGYIERSKIQKCDLVFLIGVLKYYRNFFDHKKLPLNDPAIVEAMGVLFAKAAAVESAATELLDWYTKDLSYGYENSVTLINAFKSAERSFAAESTNLGHVTRIFSHAVLKERLKTEHQELYDLLYPPPKEAKAYEPPPSVSTVEAKENAKYASLRLKVQQTQVLTPVVEKLEAKMSKKKEEWFKAYCNHIDAVLNGDKNRELPRAARYLIVDLDPNPDHHNSKDSTHSLTDLILTVSGAKVTDTQDPQTPIEYINFANSQSIQILTDVLKYGTADQIKGLWDWVSVNPSFASIAMQKCLEVLPTHCAKKNLSFFLECFKRYQKEHGKFANTLPVHCQTITLALTKIVSVGALETRELVNWHKGYFTDHLYHFSKAQLKDVPGLLRLVSEQPEYLEKLAFVDGTSVYQAKEIELAYREKYKKKSDWYLKYDEEGKAIATVEERQVILQFTNNPGLNTDELEALEQSIVENWKLHMKSLLSAISVPSLQ